MKEKQPPVGRFAPSPSGRMHLGNVFCALLAWLAARAEHGTIILRHEDLDPERCPRRYACLLYTSINCVFPKEKARYRLLALYAIQNL